MKTIVRRNLAKWIIEGLLIVLSVLLAFYVENIRQDRAEQKSLIKSLHELKESIAVDTVAFRIIAEDFIPELDTTYQEILKISMNPKDTARYVLQLLILMNNEVPKYTNWTLSRMLQNDELKDLDWDFKKGLLEYAMSLEDLEKADREIIQENNKKALSLIFSGLRYKDDYAKLYGLGADQPIIRYRAYRDSSIVYSDQLKGLIIHNLIALQSHRYKLLNHGDNAKAIIMQIDEKLNGLE